MSTDHLPAVLRELAADAESGLLAPVSDDLWRAGRRRRVTGVVVPLMVAACVVALVALVVWPSGLPRAALPAVRVDGTDRLSAYPDTIAKPPFVHVTTTPGVTAALVPSVGLVSQPYAVSPGGSVTQVELPAGRIDFSDLQPSLSPDGRWAARGIVLTDLVGGVTMPSPKDLAELGHRWTPPLEPSWWSPDSRHAFMATFNQGRVRSGGLVVGVNGSTAEVPSSRVGSRRPLPDGWTTTPSSPCSTSARERRGFGCSRGLSGTRRGRRPLLSCRGRRRSQLSCGLCCRPTDSDCSSLRPTSRSRRAR
ncbi:MAG: hypothetical protein ABIP45_02915 [Knoellia sp.]